MKFLVGFLCMALLGCPKAPVSHGPDILLEAAQSRTISYAMRGRFSAKLSMSDQAVPSLPGALLLHPPGRMRLAMNAPIGGPVFTAVSDGTGLLLLLHRDGRAVLSEDFSETMRSMFGIEVTPDFFTQALMCTAPFDVKTPEQVVTTSEGTTFHYTGLRGTRIEMSLQVEGMIDTLRASDGEGQLQLELQCSNPKKVEGQWMPGVIELTVPPLATGLRLKFSDWVEMTRIPDAFGLDVPSGIETVGFGDIPVSLEQP